jgi:phage N-6-adenine-methyltransferase
MLRRLEEGEGKGREDGGMNRAQISGLTSSATDEWATPLSFFRTVALEFGPFDLDPCANADNAKAPRFFTREQNGLAQEWTGKVWMNPPYGRFIPDWMAKAWESARGGALVVCLVPARTDTAWWHDFVEGKTEVRFIRGRLKFGGCKDSAPFPSALVIFRPTA